MKHFQLLLFFFVFFSLTSYSQSFVWKVEGKETQFYIGGSIHTIREQDYPLPNEFEKAFKEAEHLILEVDINQKNMEDANRELVGLTLYPNGKSLKTELRDDVYEKLDSVFSSSGLSLERMNGLKPVMAILTLTSIELKRQGISTKGVDKYFYEKASEQGKKIHALESVEDQIKMVAQMSDGTENDYVLQSLEDLKFYSEEFDKTIAFWRRGDTSLWLEQLEKYQRDYPDLYHALLVERNNNWMVQLEKYIETPEVEFVVVGAMHLIGSDGILHQLSNNGYKVSQF